MYTLIPLIFATLSLTLVSAQESLSPVPDNEIPTIRYPSEALLYNPIYQPIKDPGFENNIEIVQTEPWITLGWATINTDPTLARNGSQSIFFNATLARPEFAHHYAFGLRQILTVYPGFEYTLQFWAKTIPNPSGISNCTLDVCMGGRCTFLRKDIGTGPLSNHGYLSDEWGYYKQTFRAEGTVSQKGGDKTFIVPFPEKKDDPRPVRASLSILGARCWAYLLIDDVELVLDPYQHMWAGY